MPITIEITPKHDDDDGASEQQQAITLRLVFYGLKVSSETEVIANIAKPTVANVGDLTRCISQWCVQQQQQQASSQTSIANIKLNLGGVTLTDAKESIQHAVARVTKGKLSSIPKLFVSGSFQSAAGSSSLDAAGASSGSTGLSHATAAAERRQRGGGEPNMPPEMTEAMINMMTANPAFLDSILQSDPAMRRMMEANPELRQQLRDPDTIRSIMRSQMSREGRTMADNEMRAALSFIQSHPDGAAAIERALGSAGIVGEDGNNGSVLALGHGERSMEDEIADANREQQQQQQREQLQQAMPAMMNPFAAATANPFFMPQQQPPTAVVAAQTQQQSQQQQEQQKQQRIQSCVAQLQDMGFEDKELCELAATEANGDVDKAVGLIEEWQN